MSFYEGDQLLGTVVLNGTDKKTSYASSALPPGSHTITVRYSGVTPGGESSASVVQLVNSSAQCR